MCVCAVSSCNTCTRFTHMATKDGSSMSACCMRDDPSRRHTFSKLTKDCCTLLLPSPSPRTMHAAVPVEVVLQVEVFLRCGWRASLCMCWHVGGVTKACRYDLCYTYTCAQTCTQRNIHIHKKHKHSINYIPARSITVCTTVGACRQSRDRVEIAATLNVSSLVELGWG